MPMGAMGLALASSMSGFISFGLTLNIFGKKNFLAIISKKLAVILFATALVSTFVSLLLKELFHVYF
jgi:putative peptidoglycan lipid II flippase